MPPAPTRSTRPAPSRPRSSTSEAETGPVRLDFNHFLTAIDTTTTASTADFQGLLPTQGNADGYSGNGLWHLSQIRGTQAGHSQRFSMYFGSETTNTYGTSATGVLLSPTIDLSSVSGTITLNLNYFLQAAGQPPSTARSTPPRSPSSDPVASEP